MKTLTAKELALYLGCECMADERRATIEGVSTHPLIEMVTVRFIDTDDDWTVHNDLSQIKPILRPLSDMTAEEAEEFALLCMNSKCPPEGYEPIESDEIQIELVNDDGGNMLDADIELYIGVACRCFEGCILIMKDGRIGICDEDEPSEEMKPVHDAYGTIFYLISKHFDLLNWIGQNLAIDKTTLK